MLRFRFVAQIQSSARPRNKVEAVDSINAPHDAVEEAEDGAAVKDAGVVYGLPACPPPRRWDQVEPSVAASDDGRGEQPEAVVAVAPAPKDETAVAVVPPADAVAPKDVVEETQDGAIAIEDPRVVSLSTSATPGSVSVQKIDGLLIVCQSLSHSLSNPSVPFSQSQC